MARADEKRGQLVGCPTCGTKVADVDLRLRDFSWVNESLPAKVGLMDIDGVLSSAKTGKTLMVEMKPPGGYVSRGAKLTYRELVKKDGIDVWTFWGPFPDGSVELSSINRYGRFDDLERMPMERGAERVAQWWDEAQS